MFPAATDDKLNELLARLASVFIRNPFLITLIASAFLRKKASDLFSVHGGFWNVPDCLRMDGPVALAY